jgi:hypothetical protein
VERITAAQVTQAEAAVVALVLYQALHQAEAHHHQVKATLVEVEM